VADVFGVDASSLHELPRPLAGIGDSPDIVVGRMLDRSDQFLVPYRAKLSALAGQIAAALTRACAKAGDPRACAIAELRAPAARLWRSSDAEASVAALARAHAGDAAPAMLRTIIAELLGDERFFVLQNEATAGNGTPAFDRRRLASRLALVLWSSVPDLELLRRAEAGTLDDPAALAAEVRRMMTDARFQRFGRELARQWLRLDRPPAFRPSLAERKLVDDPKRFAAALDEAAALIQKQVATGAPLAELVTGEHGLLTSGAVLGAISTEIRNGGDESWLGRGVLVQSSLLCRTFPLAAVYPWKTWKDHPLLDPHVAAKSKRPGERVLLDMRTRDNPCRACHRQLETIGASLWMYDGFGRPDRSAKPFVGTIAGKRVAGPRELGRWILDTGRFEPCVAQKLLTYVRGRAVLPAKRAGDRCLVDALTSGGPPTLAGLLVQSLAGIGAQGADVVRDKPTPSPSSNDYLDPLPPVAVTDAQCAGFDPARFLRDSCGTAACHGPGSTVTAFALPDVRDIAAVLSKAEASPDGYCSDEGGLLDRKRPGESLLIRKLTAGGKMCGGPMPITGGPRTLNPVEHACFTRWAARVPL